MSQTYQIPDTAVLETPLAAQLSATHPSALELQMHRGAQTPLRFSASGTELEALLQGAGVFDLGYRTFFRATGKDRVRWLNGMITQAVKSMTPGQVGYTLVLNPQGRIQGDGDVLAYDDSLLFETDRSQSARLLAHLRRFIIMDDVKLDELDGSNTAIGIAGPHAATILEKLGGSLPDPGTYQTGQLAGIDVTLVHAWGPVVTRGEIHVASDQVLRLWNELIAAGASTCGLAAMEDLRVLEGTPQYDVDFSDKHLPQEANLPHALNFTKGCYIGQEIVERIRSRATVHRGLRQFELQGVAPSLGTGEKIELRAGDAAVGELTSVARIELPAGAKNLALGVARLEALEKSAVEPIRYEGGVAVPLATPPVPAT
ncbi:MAG TPA: folate-binding protein [Acidobacteriaceae bacterium]|jgi:folate-binding protein YgfZ|nr:folate-binding protein [Acidobacteriaceae bacterium]